MASIRKDPRTGTFNISFWFGGKKFNKSLRTQLESQAQTRQAVIEELLDAIKRGLIDEPAPSDLWTFLYTGGKVKRNPERHKPEQKKNITLGELFARYDSDLPPGALEPSTLATLRHHKRHILDRLITDTDAESLSLSPMQRHVNKRAKDEYRGKYI